MPFSRAKRIARDLALGAALAEAARHQDRVHLLQRADAVLLDLLGVDVVDLDAWRAVWMPACVSASFSDL